MLACRKQVSLANARTEEFSAYILTLGLSPVLTIASALLNSDETSASDAPGSLDPLATAEQCGWTKWTPPASGESRSLFLKEQLNRLYEKRIRAQASAEEARRVSAQSPEMREYRRQHGQYLADELRRARMSTNNLPPLRSTMANERPMSEWEPMLTMLAKDQPSSLAHDKPASRAPSSPATLVSPMSISTSKSSIGRPTPASSNASSHPPSRYHLPPQRAGTDPHSDQMHPAVQRQPRPASYDGGAAAAASRSVSNATTVVASTRNSSSNAAAIHPAYRGDLHPAFRDKAALAQHPAQRQLTMHPGADLAADTADRAVFRVVEMGFTPDQARYALRKTDPGDGLKVDRAVEYLLMRTGQAW